MIHRRIHQLVLAVFAPAARTASTVTEATVPHSPSGSGGHRDLAHPSGPRSGWAGGSTPRTVVLPPAPAPVRDEPPSGDPDLARWPISLAERALSAEIVAGVDRSIELLEVTGSVDRALAVLAQVRATVREGVAA